MRLTLIRKRLGDADNQDIKDAELISHEVISHEVISHEQISVTEGAIRKPSPNLVPNKLAPNKLASDKISASNKLASNKLASNKLASDHEARFDLNGVLVTNETLLTGREGLHHHGNDPHRAGYTLNELLILIESTFPSQKILALNMVGKIMERSNHGLYDGVFDESIAQSLLTKTPILLMLRRALDDTNVSIISAAITCLKGIICNTDLDELHLDRTFSWDSNDHACFPFLDTFIDSSSITESFQSGSRSPNRKRSSSGGNFQSGNNPLTDEDANLDEIKDERLIKIDPIRGLIRTSLLERLRFLLDNNFQSADDAIIIKNVFSILIRIARQSEFSINAIYNCPYLIESMMKNFLPETVNIGF